MSKRINLFFITYDYDPFFLHGENLRHDPRLLRGKGGRAEDNVDSLLTINLMVVYSAHM